MSLTRRQLLIGSAALLVSARSTVRSAWGADTAAVAALDHSKLIYLTPLLKDGRESSCQSEIWFVHHQREIYVSTGSQAWRTEAIRRGYPRARIWVGEFGNWKGARDKYRAAPSLDMEGRLETDPTVQAEVLAVYGKKYADEWDKWGPRFHDGLADGSRALLRYQILA
jgi:hypothetical protein